MRRTAKTGEDVAASDYVNGIVLPVDGGWLGR
jgi:hypothetical protein